MDVGNLISGSSAFSKTSLNIWKFTVHVLLKSGLENFEHYFTSVWDECNCVVVWAFFGIAFLWDWRRQRHPTPVLLPGKSHGRRSLVGCSPWGHEESDKTERLHSHFSLSCIEEGNGNPLQCSCLENPRDGGAWWAAVYGVAQSRTQRKWLSSSGTFQAPFCEGRLQSSATGISGGLLPGQFAQPNLWEGKNYWIWVANRFQNSSWKWKWYSLKYKKDLLGCISEKNEVHFT